MNKFYTVCMFGGASNEISPHYLKKMEELGEMIAKNNCLLVYGAGATGCMGGVARGVSKAGGNVFGVTPEFMNQFKEVYPCDKLIKTKTMNERKTLMEEHADFFVIAPGGIGTMDEMFEVLTLKYLNQNNKPIVFYNIDGFYTDILDFIDNIIEKKFINKRILNLFKVCNTLEEVEQELLEAISASNK